MTEAHSSGARRIRRSRSEAEQLAAEYETSGMRREEFCRLKGVTLKTLARYVTRRRREQGDGNTAQRWVAVEIADPRKMETALTVVVNGGRRVEVGRGFDAETLQQLIRALERS